MRSVILLVPGLLPAPGGALQQDYPPVPFLRRALACADPIETPPDYLTLLADQFGLPRPANADWPAGAWSYLEDTGAIPAGSCMRADPVHLATGRDGLVLLDSSLLDISHEEAAALAQDIQPLLEAYHAVLKVIAPARWYLQLASAPALKTTPLFDAAGHDIGNILPRGDAQRDWHRLLNEIQMVLHEHPVNRDRESRGMLPVNSLWFWGAGEIPAQCACDPIDVIANETVARGLARWCGFSPQSLPEDASVLLQQDRTRQQTLVVIDNGCLCRAYGDMAGWLHLLDWLERHWIAPLVNALKRRQIRSLSLLMPGQGYHLKRWHLWRLWRRDDPLMAQAIPRKVDNSIS